MFVKYLTPFPAESSEDMCEHGTLSRCCFENCSVDVEYPLALNKYKNTTLIKVYILEIDNYFTNNDPRFFVGPLGINVMVYQIDQITDIERSFFFKKISSFCRCCMNTLLLSRALF